MVENGTIVPGNGSTTLHGSTIHSTFSKTLKETHTLWRCKLGEKKFIKNNISSHSRVSLFLPMFHQQAFINETLPNYL